MNTKHKFTELQKIEVRAEYNARKALRSLRQMAKDLGVTTTTLYRAIHDDYLELNHRRKVRECVQAETSQSQQVEGN